MKANTQKAHDPENIFKAKWKKYMEFLSVKFLFAYFRTHFLALVLPAAVLTVT